MEVVFGTPHEGLSIGRVERDHALIRVVSPGLQAEKRVYAYEPHGFDGLTEFFVSLEKDWRGWTGQRGWTSLESDLRLTASHDGHVRVKVVLTTAEWTVDTSFTIEPGEHLSSAAATLASLFG